MSRENQRRYRAAIIGDSGRGNYGHGLDVAFTRLPMVEVVAVADPDAEGRSKAQARSGAPAAYADYREMLARERPNLVAIAPRWVGKRVEMVEAAAAVGAHIYLEKPMAASLADADAMLAACTRAGVKMAVAHQGRLHPAVLHALRLVQEGEIGRLRLIRGFGKMDHRGGGQDLMVLGTHVLDLMRLFGGNAAWASAELLVGSRLATSADVRAGDEEIGPIAGDGLRATYGFENGVIGTFESFAGLAASEDLFGLELVGEQGQLSLRGGFTKRLLRYARPFIRPGATYDCWEPVLVPDAGPGETPEAPPGDDDLTLRCNQRIVLDLLAAIEEDREPLGSGERALAALELIQAVAAAHAAGGRVTLPLRQRSHPYAGLV
jgi:predicted dehydrogenase